MEVATNPLNRADLPELLTTAEFAAAQRCKPQTVLKNHCLNGHHHGIKPIKQPGGRLLWRLSDLQKMLGEVA
jgi:hypothetical protein